MSEVNDVSTMREQRLSQQIDQIGKHLSEAETKEMARVPERVFQQVFLPMFAGDEELVYPEQATLVNWTRIAGSPYHSVNVIDSIGNVLFVVPPIYDRSAVNPERGDGPSLQHIVLTAEQYGAQSPAQGENYLNAKLTERALIMKVPVNVLQHVEAWNKIFARYNRPPILELEETAVEAKQSKESSDFEMEFTTDD